MNGARSSGTALAVLALLLAWTGPAAALVDCLVPLYGDTLTLNREGYALVPEEVLPDDFSDVFDLYVYWDWGNEEWWPDEEVIAFANLVMPNWYSAATPDSSFAHRTAHMFGCDKDFDYPDVEFDYKWGGSQYNLSHFDIFIRSEAYGGSYGNHDYVILGLQGPDLTAEEVAMDHFAHEWAHTCYYSTGASGSNGCPSFGDQWQIGGTWSNGTGEFMAKASEFYNGMVAENWYGDFVEQPFTVGIGRGDWYERCQYCNSSANLCEDGRHVIGSDRRWIYYPFAAYLQDHFNDEGLLYWS